MNMLSSPKHFNNNRSCLHVASFLCKDRQCWAGVDREQDNPVTRTRPVKPPIHLFKLQSTAEFYILALDVTGLRFCSWEPLLCLGSASVGPLPFI